MESNGEISVLLGERLGIGILQKYVFKANAIDGTLDELFAKCLELGVKQFQDASFPPSRKSLIEDWEDDHCAQENIEEGKWNEIVWKRATDIPSLNKDGKLAIFYEGIEPNDVKQG